MVCPTEKLHSSDTSFTRRQKIWLIHTLKWDLQNSSPFWPTRSPNAAPQPSALALLACVSLCAALEGPVSPSLGLCCPCAALTGPAAALRGSCCLCLASTGLRSIWLPLRCSYAASLPLLYSWPGIKPFPCQYCPSPHFKLLLKFLANHALEFHLSFSASPMRVSSN